MIDKLKGILDINSRYYAISVSNTKEATNYFLIQFLFKNNELTIENKWAFNELEDIKNYAKKDYPLLLHLEGDGIINKTTDNASGYRKNLVFKSNLDDFHFYEYKQENVVYASVVRKELVNKYIQLLNDLGLFTVNVSFGPFVMANLLPFIKNLSNLSSSNYYLGLNEKGISSFKSYTNNYEVFKINGDTFNQSEIPLVATFFNHNFPNKSIEFDTSFTEDNKNELKFKKWFKIAGVFALVFILSSILISNILLNNYLTKLAQKEASYSLTQQTSAQIASLTEEKKLKENILLKSGMVQNSISTEYIAEIGNITPTNITLNTIHVNPWSSKVKPDKRIDFDLNKIIVNGTTSNDDVFNNWVKKIKTLKWINKIEIVEYFKENKTINSFSISISIERV